jgi:hypothetical protein
MQMRRPVVVGLALATLLTGCRKPKEGDKPAPAVSVLPSGPSAAPPPADAGAAKAASAPSSASAFAGTYTLAPAAIHIPESKDYAHVKQAKDEPSKLVGNGSISLAIDANGRVTGEIDAGPASPAVLDGSVVDGEVRAQVRRKDPSDGGLFGTFVGKIAGAAIDGKLSLSDANATLVREGTVSLKKK